MENGWFQESTLFSYSMESTYRTYDRICHFPFNFSLFGSIIKLSFVSVFFRVCLNETFKFQPIQRIIALYFWVEIDSEKSL